MTNINGQEIKTLANKYFVGASEFDLSNADLTRLNALDEAFENDQENYDIQLEAEELILNDSKLLLVEFNRTTGKYQIAADQVKMLVDDMEVADKQRFEELSGYDEFTDVSDIYTVEA